MKTDSLSAFLTCVHLLLVTVQGSGDNVTGENNPGTYGGRILNGAKANPDDYRNVVRLDVDGEMCGGSVISNYVILTAGHCVAGLDCRTVGISPSNWAFGDTPKFYGSSCLIHQFYRKRNPYLFDIALLKTQDDLIAGGLKISDLPAPRSIVPSYARGVIVGWGKTASGAGSDHLLRGDVKMLDWAGCNYHYNHCDFCPSPEVPKEALCVVGTRPEPAGGCAGDSGGPLLIDGVVAGLMIYAITGRSGVCSIRGSPVLCLPVAEYLTWIHSHMAHISD